MEEDLNLLLKETFTFAETLQVYSASSTLCGIPVCAELGIVDVGSDEALAP